MQIISNILKDIRYRRELKRYTQEHMANLLDITVVAYGDMERGKSKITLERLLIIADHLEIPLSKYFNTGTDSISEENYVNYREIELSFGIVNQLKHLPLLDLILGHAYKSDHKSFLVDLKIFLKNASFRIPYLEEQVERILAENYVLVPFDYKKLNKKYKDYKINYNARYMRNALVHRLFSILDKYNTRGEYSQVTSFQDLKTQEVFP